MSQHVTTSPNSQQSCNVVYVILSSFRHRDHRPKMANVHSRVHFGGTAKSQLWSLCSVLRGSMILRLTAWPARFEVLLRLASHEHGAKSRRYQDFEALCWSLLHLIDSSGAHSVHCTHLHTVRSQYGYGFGYGAGGTVAPFRCRSPRFAMCHDLSNSKQSSLALPRNSWCILTHCFLKFQFQWVKSARKWPTQSQLEAKQVISTEPAMIEARAQSVSKTCSVEVIWSAY